MTIVLDRDLGADVYDRFHDRLFRGTLHKRTPGSYSSLDPAAGSNPSIADYVFDGYAFGYKQRYVDGERVKKGDYRVVMLRASIGVLNNDAIAASLDLSTVTPDITTVLEARVTGPAGDFITVELVGDAALAPGTYNETGQAAQFHFKPGATSVAQLEALCAFSTLVQVKTSGAVATLQLVDVLAPTGLDGGLEATLNFDPTIVPNPGDRIDIPPPGQTSAKTSTVVLVEVLTEAQVTCQVRGAPT